MLGYGSEWASLESRDGSLEHLPVKVWLRNPDFGQRTPPVGARFPRRQFLPLTDARPDRMRLGLPESDWPQRNRNESWAKQHAQILLEVWHREQTGMQSSAGPKARTEDCSGQTLGVLMELPDRPGSSAWDQGKVESLQLFGVLGAIFGRWEPRL